MTDEFDQIVNEALTLLPEQVAAILGVSKFIAEIEMRQMEAAENFGTGGGGEKEQKIIERIIDYGSVPGVKLT